jgi:hypothetical protein
VTGYAEEVAGGHDGRVLVWDPAEPGTPLVELGRHENWVEAVAVLPDGAGGHRRPRRAAPAVGSRRTGHLTSRTRPL